MPIQPDPELNLYTNGRITKLPKNLETKKETHNDHRDIDLGPGAYNHKSTLGGNMFSFGSRFNSKFKSKDHLRPTKVDGPGPGSYKMPSSVRTGRRSESINDALKRTTFG